MISILTRLWAALNIRQDRSALQVFAFGIGVILALIAGYSYLTADHFQLWSILAALISIGIGFFAPQFILPIYLPWVFVTKLLGIAITTVLLSLVFYLVFLPLGLVLRRGNKNPFEPKKDAESYWEDREENGDKRMDRMF